MKIDGISPAESPLPVESTVARVANVEPAGTQAAAGAQGAGQDWTSFQSDSTSVKSLTSQALSSPEIRQGTVDALRQSVDSGQYPLDATRIAAAISTSSGGG